MDKEKAKELLNLLEVIPENQPMVIGGRGEGRIEIVSKTTIDTSILDECELEIALKTIKDLECLSVIRATSVLELCLKVFKEIRLNQ